MTTSNARASLPALLSTGMLAVALFSNAHAATTCLASLPDLSLSAVAVGQDPVTSGGQLTFTASLNHDGVGTLPWVLGLYYVSSDPVVNELDTPVGYFFESSVATGEHRSMHSTLWLPTLAPGTYYISGLLDFGNYIVEDNENNNWSTPIPVVVVAR